MCTRLTIDCGNTATKAVVWEGDRALFEGVFPEFSRTVLTELVGKYRTSSAIVCSVRDSGCRLVSVLRELIGADSVVINLNPSTPLPIKIDYSTPKTLGVDRVAAAVGASALCPGKEVLIADIGTAATYDVLSAEGHFIGGNISPGVGMRLRALNRFTARLPLIDSKGETPVFGNSTETALRAGAINGVVAELLYYHSMLSPGASLLMTGGWASDIVRFIPQLKPQIVPMLVCIGLNRILSYNENI